MTEPGHRHEHQLRWYVRSLSVLSAALVVTLAVMLPRAMSYPGLVEENMSLKGSLQQMDARVDEMDRLLLRMRLYDVQLRSLTDPSGPAGPLHRSLGTGETVEETRSALTRAASVEPPGESRDLRPAEAWAEALDARAESFLATMEAAEPDVSWVVEELEELRALEQELTQLATALVAPDQVANVLAAGAVPPRRNLLVDEELQRVRQGDVHGRHTEDLSGWQELASAANLSIGTVFLDEIELPLDLQTRCSGCEDVARTAHPPGGARPRHGSATRRVWCS